MPPDVSVIIPTRDRAAHLANAVDSVLGQVGIDLEIIVVDDGSSTPVEPLTGSAGRTVTIVRSPRPRGPATARNLGASQARGRLLAFLDDDDYWLPGKLAACLPLFDRYPDLEWLFHRTAVVGDRRRGSGAFHRLSDPVARLLNRQAPHINGLVVRRETHKRVKFDERLDALEDVDYVLRLALAAPGGELDLVLAEHGPDTTRGTAIPLASRIAARRVFRDKHAALFTDRRTRCFHHLRLGHLYRRAGDRRSAVASFVRALPSTHTALGAVKGIAATALLAVDDANRTTGATQVPGSVKKPSFFIVGAQKCGTTSMYRYLLQHPGIFLPDRVEMNFFSDAFTRHAVKTIDEYLRCFAGAHEGQVVGEKSAAYLFCEETPRRLRAFDPAAKILIMLRHPVELVASLHRQFLHTGNEDILDLREALRAADARARGEYLPRGAHMPRFLQYQRVATLTPQVERYLDMFGADQVLVVLLDDLSRAPAACYRRVLEFLQVDPSFTPSFEIHNPVKRVPNLGLRRMARRNRMLNRAMHVLFPEKVVSLGTEAFSVLQTQPRYHIADALYDELLDEFADDIRALGQLIDRDLSHWLAPRARAVTPTSASTGLRE